LNFYDNQFGIPENELKRIRTRDKNCVYCHKEMIFPYDINNRKDSATIEHLSPVPPFYLKDGMQMNNITICCGSCNSSRGVKKLRDWFETTYCVERNINEDTVSSPVKEYLNRKKIRISILNVFH
jgi:hypothetical protein